LEVPKTLSRPARNEKNIVAALIEREVKRIHYNNERKKLRSQSKGAHDAAIQEANMLAAAKAKAESSTTEGESKKEDSQSKEEQSYKAMEKE
jgi:hypothetical protein